MTQPTPTKSPEETEEQPADPAKEEQAMEDVQKDAAEQRKQGGYQ